MSIETGPQDAWWRLEDLLARLGMHCAVTVQEDPDAGPVVTVHGLRGLTNPELAELRRAALDADSYQCWRQGRVLAFVQTLDWLADDLVLNFTPMRRLERWDEGPELVWQVRGFLARLQRQSRIRRVS